ncbi:MAG: GAF domain-containing protein [Anaerolineae bacterium]|nr:GAF domain-containing protein [Anaerolineae bacterium]MDW8101468.1 GAF domain-containing protein [Anaerolineae bacterium]
MKNLPIQAWLDGIATAILVISPQGEITFANRKALEILESTLEGVVGKPISFFVKNFDEKTIEALAKRTAPTTFAFKTFIICPSGKKISVLVTPSLVWDNGELRALILTLEKAPPSPPPAQYLPILASVARAASSSLHLEEIAEAVYKELAKAIPLDAFYIALYYPETEELDFIIRVDEGIKEPRERRKLAPGLTQIVLKNTAPLLIADLEKEPYPFTLWGTGKVPRSYLGVPMIAEDKVMGVISVQSYTPASYSWEDVEMLMTVASHLALTFRNALLHDQIVKLANRLSILNEIARHTIILTDIENILQKITQIIWEKLGHYGVLLFLVEGEEAVLRAVAGELARVAGPGYRQHLSQGIIGWSITRNEITLCNDVLKDSRYIPGPVPLGLVKSELCVPISFKGKTIGAIDLQDTQPGAFSPEDATTLEAVASLVAIVLHNARLYQSLREERKLLRTSADALPLEIMVLNQDMMIVAANRTLLENYKLTLGEVIGKPWRDVLKSSEIEARVQEAFRENRLVVWEEKEGEKAYRAFVTPVPETPWAVLGRQDITSEKALAEKLKIIHKLGRELVMAQDEDYVIQAVLEAAYSALGFKTVAYLEVDRTENIIRLRGIKGYELSRDFSLPLDGEKGLTVAAVRSGELLYVPDVTKDPRFVPGPRELNTRSEVDIPVKVRGEVTGVLNVEDEREDAFSPEDIRLLTTLADYMGIALENIRLFQAEKKSRILAEALSRAVVRLSSTLELESILDLILEQVSSIVQGDAFNILFVEGDKAKVIRARGYEKFGLAEMVQGLILPLYPNLRRMMETGQVVLIPDTESEPEWVKIPGFEWLRSYVAAPIRLGSETIGFLCVDGTVPGQFSYEDARRLEIFASAAAVAINNARLTYELKESEARYRSLSEEWELTFNSINDAVFIASNDFTILRANKATAKLLGFSSPEELIGFKCYTLVHGTREPTPDCPFNKMLATQKPVSEEIEEPHLKRILSIGLFPVFNQEGQIVSFVHSIRDVTAEREFRERLFQAEKLASIGQLISGVAHELNNPLTSVLAHAQLLSLDPSMPESARESLKWIEEEARRAASIVQNLLDFVRRRPPKREMTDINELIRKTISLRAYEMRVENIETKTELAPFLPLTLADPQQLQQVFLNIIINAEQAMYEAHRGGTLIVRTSLTPENYIRIEFCDDGPGIPKEHMSRIFDPFFTTKEKGTGMGLTIAYNLVKEHGGRIWARNNTPEPGVTFFVEIPLTAGEEEKWAEELLKQLEEKLPSARALVVEDEKAIAIVLETFLMREGIEVHTVADGEEALKILENQDFDLIISDVRLPKLSGMALYDMVKASKPHLADRFVFITGDVLTPATEAFLHSTGSLYLMKPFSISQLREVTEKALRKRRDAVC